MRVREVRRMLQSARPVRIALKQKPEVRLVVLASACVHVFEDEFAILVSDHQFVEQQETHLLMLSQRTMALPVGRSVYLMIA